MIIKESVILPLVIIAAIFTYFQLSVFSLESAEVQFVLFTDCAKHALVVALIHR